MNSGPPALGLSIGRYTLERQLGQGGFAWVYAARRDDGKSFAVKVLKPRYASDPAFESRFRQEFALAADLRHPNIVRIEDIAQGEGLTFFAMELFPDTLTARLERDRVLAEGDVAAIALGVTQALAFAHGNGIIHRDIKPDNILLAADGRAVLTDFGIARAISGFVAATGVHMTIGTPVYISPEQAQGRPLDGRSDLYSLGITLYRAVTGEVPFKSRDWYELARMHVETAPEPPRARRPDLSKRFERIILRCLAKHPDDRYPSANALLEDLADLEAKTRATGTIPLPEGYLKDSKVGDPRKAKKWWRPW
ncbi:MAG: serine/threonine-protein kinase [Gemmatimonadales bacterium]